MNTTWVNSRRIRSLLLASLCLAVANLSGCEKGRATVTGKVTLNGQPLTAGTVTFIGGPSRVGSSIINSDGTYSVGDAPIGDVTVTVETPVQPMGPMGNMPKPPPGMKGMPADMKPPGDQSGMPVKIVPAPTKYSKADTSPLHYTITSGNQTIDLPLTP